MKDWHIFSTFYVPFIRNVRASASLKRDDSSFSPGVIAAEAETRGALARAAEIAGPKAGRRRGETGPAHALGPNTGTAAGAAARAGWESTCSDSVRPQNIMFY